MCWPTKIGVARRAELTERLVALGDLPEEEVGLGPHARRGVDAQVLEARRQLLDHLRERILVCLALLDRQAPPGGVRAEEGVGDVLATHVVQASGVSASRSWL